MKMNLKKICAVVLALVMVVPMLAVNAHAAAYIWPLDNDLNYITSYAGNRIHPLTGERQDHSGIDIRAGKGSSIYATASGTAYIGCNWCDHNYGKSKSCGCGGGYGNYVYIVHSSGMVSYYAHMTKVKVSDGQRVSQGDVIGTVGSTGSSTGYHLHFEMRTSTSRSDRTDPLNYVSIPGQDDYDANIPEEVTPTPTPSYSGNTNVIEYYTGNFGSTSQGSSGNVYDYYTPSAPSTSTGNVIETPSSGSQSSSSSKSSVSIDMTRYPSALDKGDSYNLKGTISSDAKLTRIMGRIMSAQGTTVQSVLDSTSGKTLNVNKSDINKNLRFGSLPVGSYSLLIEVTDANGDTASWSEPFTVGNVSSIPEEGAGSSGVTGSSSIEIDVTRYPTEIDRGDSFSLKGTITSDERIKSVKGYILDEDGKTLQSAASAPNARSVKIQSSAVNNKLYFGRLAKGTYTLKIVVTDNDGASSAWTQDFIVD